MWREAVDDDDDLRNILGDEDYEALSNAIHKFNPMNLTDEQIEKIKQSAFTFSYMMTGEEALLLLLAFSCTYTNACWDCNLYLND